MTSENIPIYTSAVIFDLDGVITDTATVHARAWKKLFDKYLSDTGYFALGQKPFDIVYDYKRYVDGKLRIDGIESFLRSRGISLPIGAKDDHTFETITGLGNIKNDEFLSLLNVEGITLYPDAMKIISDLHNKEVPMAVASSSKNCSYILESANIKRYFDVVLGGDYISARGLKSKPAPDIFLEASRLLGVDIRKTVIIEDAPAGVKAAAESKANIVIGLDRHAEKNLSEFGADMILYTLANIDIHLDSNCN